VHSSASYSASSVLQLAIWQMDFGNNSIDYNCQPFGFEWQKRRKEMRKCTSVSKWHKLNHILAHCLLCRHGRKGHKNDNRQAHKKWQTFTGVEYREIFI